MVTACSWRRPALPGYRSWLPAVVMGLLATGCQRTPSACRMAGEALVNGNAADGVYIVFHSENAHQGPATVAVRTGEDGSFSGDLPQPGRYAITAFWPKVIVTPEETIEGDDRFRGTYRDVQRPILSVEIKEGQNDLKPLDFQLK